MKRHLHVAYVVHGFPERSETFIANEIARVRQAGITVTLHTTRDPVVAAPDLQALAGAAGDRLPDLAALTWPKILRTLLRLARRHPIGVATSVLLLLRDPQWENRKAFKFAAVHASRLIGGHVDLIHAHFADLPAGVAMFSSRILGVPFTFTGHAYDLFQEPFDLRRKLRRAARVIEVCEYNRRLVAAEHGDIGHHTYVPCGVDATAFVRSDSAGDDTGLRIAAVGRLVPKKGFQDLIDALAILDGSGTEFQCRLVGDGPLLAELKGQVRDSGLEDHIVFLGEQPPDVVRQTLDEANVFCLPCVVADNGDRDSQPVVIKEAMALELPVVSTREVGVPEMVEHATTGLLVPPGDPLALAAALLQIANTPERSRAMGIKGRERVEATFDFSVTIPVLLSVWQDVVSRAS